MHTAMCKIDSSWESAVWPRALSPVLHGDLGGGGGRAEREAQEGGDETKD